jgi:ribosomal protein S18 acetylase RimI-like enzyme
MLRFRPLLPGEATHWSAQPYTTPAATVHEFEVFPGDWSDDFGFDAQFFDTFEASGQQNLPPFSESTYRQHLENLIKQGSAVGAFSNNQCLGLAAAQPTNRPGWWELWECQVKDNYRRNGIGSQLLGNLEEQLQSLGARNLIVLVAADNKSLTTFLQGNNFRAAGMEQSDYPMIIYQKSLVHTC